MKGRFVGKQTAQWHNRSMSREHTSSATEHFSKLRRFRQAAYEQFGNARDALFELTDAVIQMRQVQSFAELSCAPMFRRQWSSAYEALQDGRPDRIGLLRLYLQMYAVPARPILAGDHTAWPRLWASTVAQRSYQHQPTPIPGRRPITIGHGYSTIAVIPQQGSWALPLLHERISNQKPIVVAAQQLASVCQMLAVRPITLWDSEYSSGVFLNLTANVKADKLIRLRTNLCLEGSTLIPYKGRGRHPTRGMPFKFKDPSTWWPPEEEFAGEDERFGPLQVRVWHGLRFRQARSCPISVALVERPQASGSRRKPRFLWFGWVGEASPPQWWGIYAWRYPIDHWYRFIKGRLHWTLPRLASVEPAERWSDLMPFITWEAWLAKDWVEDHPLPWQKPQRQLSPGRTCQALQNILPAIGTPARVCKSRGKSPGWPTGKARTPRPPVDLIRSAVWKEIRRRKKLSQTGERPKRGRQKQVLSL